MTLERPQEDEALAVAKQDLKSRLWGAANSLRGPVDPANERRICQEVAEIGEA